MLLRTESTPGPPDSDLGLINQTLLLIQVSKDTEGFPGVRLYFNYLISQKRCKIILIYTYLVFDLHVANRCVSGSQNTFF